MISQLTSKLTNANGEMATVKSIYKSRIKKAQDAYDQKELSLISQINKLEKVLDSTTSQIESDSTKIETLKAENDKLKAEIEEN